MSPYPFLKKQNTFRATFVLIPITGTYILKYGNYETKELIKECSECSQFSVSTDFVVQLIFSHKLNSFPKCFY